MQIAKLTVDLLADNRQFENALKSSQSSMKNFNQGINKSLASMRGGFLAAGAAAAALIATSKIVGQQTDELYRLSEQSRIGFEEFQALTHAASRYGIEAAKVADISKDVTDKLGDFIATGAGPFTDFFENVAPKVGLTAQALQGLSGPQVLQAVKNAMDEANVSMEEQIFYLESLANDSSLLAPLLADNGAELRNMSDEFERTNRAISKQDAEKLRVMNQSFDDLAQSAQTAAATIISKLSPAIIGLNRVLINIMNPVDDLDAGLEESLENIKISIQKKQAEIAEIAAQGAADIYKSMGTGYVLKTDQGIEGEKNRQLAAANSALQALIQQRTELQAQLDTLNQPDIDVVEPALPAIQPAGVTGETGETGTDSTGEEDRIRERMDRELAMLLESFLNEQQLIDLNEQQKLDKLEIWRQADIDGMENYEAIKTSIKNKAAADRAKIDAANNSMLLRNSSNLFGGMADLAGAFAGEQSGVYKAMFAVSKAFSIAESIIAIQTGIAKAAATPFPANLAAMATVAASTMGIITTITGTNIQGVAHDGINSIPTEGTWLLDKGERVLSANQNKDLTSQLNSNSPRQPWIINVIDAPPGTTTQVNEQEQMISIAVGRAVDTVEGNVRRGGNSTSGAFEESYGLNRAWGI